MYLWLYAPFILMLLNPPSAVVRMWEHSPILLLGFALVRGDSEVKKKVQLKHKCNILRLSFTVSFNGCESVSKFYNRNTFVYTSFTHKYIALEISCRYMISLSPQVRSCAVVAFLHPQRSLSLLPASHSLRHKDTHTHTHTHTHSIKTVFRHQTELIHKSNAGLVY